MSLTVTLLDAPPPAAGPLEIVERKGLGHPDTICDALAEALSRALSEFYVGRFGFVLHHNVDKALLCAGAAQQAWGGGEVLEPIAVYLGGRATRTFRGVEVPIEALAVESSRQWFREHMHALDAERHVRIHTLIRPGSADLQNLYTRGRGPGGARANDTSIGVGYAPLDDLERAVLAIEHRLNAPDTKAAWPAIGEDVKVMGVREGGTIHVTVACALIGRYVADFTQYVACREQVRALAGAAAREATALPVEVAVNAADGTTLDSVYLTVTGTSGEAGDDGEVGRGNRANGLITPYRPMSLEAAAGKNAVSHVGKLYNIAAKRLAQALVAEVAGIRAAQCFLLSRIGAPIEEPHAVQVQVRLADPAALSASRERIDELVNDQLASIGELWRQALAGELSVF